VQFTLMLLVAGRKGRDAFLKGGRSGLRGAGRRIRVALDADGGDGVAAAGGGVNDGLRKGGRSDLRGAGRQIRVVLDADGGDGVAAAGGGVNDGLRKGGRSDLRGAGRQIRVALDAGGGDGVAAAGGGAKVGVRVALVFKGWKGDGGVVVGVAKDEYQSSVHTLAEKVWFDSFLRS
jgi:hypothetical protein